MINIENFDNYPKTKYGYGGHSGRKTGILINNEKWFIKHPKSTSNMEKVNISYTTAAISEYLGSKIYESMNYDTHETKLGVSENKIAVACKDFLLDNETIFDYLLIKNAINEDVENLIIEHASSGINNELDIDDVQMIINSIKDINDSNSLNERFWDMFVIDAFINNNDRNESNWGLILNNKTFETRLTPIYDNGAAFYNKASDEHLDNALNNNRIFIQMVYDSCISVFTKNNKIINPLKFIENMDNIECNKAVLRVFPKINMGEIKKIFDDIPKNFNNLIVFSDAQRKFYYKSLEYKYENVLKNIYNKLNNKEEK